jgi:hypothetical protein
MSMKPLDPQSRRLIDEVNAGDLPSPELEARLWQALAPRLDAPLPPAAAAASRALQAKAGLFASSPVLKLVIGVVAVGASVTAVVQMRAHTPRAVAGVAHTQVHERPAPPARAVASEQAPPTAAAAESGLSAETRLLARAQRALHAGDARGALAFVDRHAAMFPHGELAQERDAARVFALCALGQRAEARSAQERFLRTWPGSPLATRVESACAKPAL